MSGTLNFATLPKTLYKESSLIYSYFFKMPENSSRQLLRIP